MKIGIILTCLFIVTFAQYKPPQFTQPPNTYSTNIPQSRNPAMPGYTPPGSMPTNSRPGSQPMTKDNLQSSETEKNGHKDRKVNNGMGDEITDQELQQLILFSIYMVSFASILCCAGTSMLICCLKKRSQRKRIKQQMEQRQNSFAQAQNMNLFQMQTQPNFPRTIHI